MTKKLKEWLRHTNGWQRLWFVASLLTIAYFVLWFPLVESGKSNEYRYNKKWAIEKEMKRQDCAPYMSQPFEGLIEPKFDLTGDDGCYNIYSHRKYDNKHSSITKESYESEFDREHWERFFTAMAIGGTFALFLSAIAYGVGYVVAWVLKGFRKSGNE